MGKLAVFLGAGASKAFGYPLTGEILPEILKRLEQGQLFKGIKREEENEEDRRSLSQFLHGLLPGLDQTSAGMPLITEILSLIDYSIAEGIALHPLKRFERMTHLRGLVERAVYETIGGHREGAAPVPKSSGNLKRFTDWLFRQSEHGEIGIISSNYDVSVDTSLFGPYLSGSPPGLVPRRADDEQTGDHTGIEEQFDFGYAWRAVETEERIHLRPQKPRFRLYKLHGSLNWARCPMCEQIYLNPLGDIASVAFRPERGWENSCHCGYYPLQMHIVAPSFVRQIREPNLREIWKCCLQLLREADEWIIIGYSFPQEDLAIRSLLTRAYHGRFTSDGQPRAARLRVIQRGCEAKARYAVYFSDPSRQEMFTYEEGGLEAFLDTLDGGQRGD